jgi:hypothetical protein
MDVAYVRSSAMENVPIGFKMWHSCVQSKHFWHHDFVPNSHNMDLVLEVLRQVQRPKARDRLRPKAWSFQVVPPPAILSISDLWKWRKSRCCHSSSL